MSIFVVLFDTKLSVQLIGSLILINEHIRNTANSNYYLEFFLVNLRLNACSVQLLHSNNLVIKIYVVSIFNFKVKAISSTVALR